MWLEFIVVIAAPSHGYHPANRNINNECHKLGTCSWGIGSMCCPDRCMPKPRHLSFESFHRHGGPLTLRVSAPLLGRMLTSLACETAAVHWEPPPLAGRGQADGQRERRMNAHACLASRSQSVRVGGGFLATALQVFSARVPLCLCRPTVVPICNDSYAVLQIRVWRLGEQSGQIHPFHCAMLLISFAV